MTTATNGARQAGKNGGGIIKMEVYPQVGDTGERADMLIKFPTGAKWLVEIVGRGRYSPEAMRHRSALAVRYAKSFPRATPVVSTHIGKQIGYFSARTGRALAMPGEK